MFGPEFINMGEYDDYYNARLESYREGFISYRDFEEGLLWSKSYINKKRLMEDVNYFLNFINDELEKIAYACKDDVYIVFKSEYPISDMEDGADFSVFKDMNVFSSKIIGMYSTACECIDCGGGLSLNLNEDYNISMYEDLIDYEIYYITRENFNSLKSKLTKDIDDRECSFRVNSSTLESAKFEKLYVDKENNYYSFDKYKSGRVKEHSNIKIESKDFDVRKDFCKSYVEVYGGFDLELIQDNTLGKDEVISSYAYDMERNKSNTEKSKSNDVEDDCPF